MKFSQRCYRTVAVVISHFRFKWNFLSSAIIHQAAVWPYKYNLNIVACLAPRRVHSRRVLSVGHGHENSEEIIPSIVIKFFMTSGETSSSVHERFGELYGDHNNTLSRLYQHRCNNSLLVRYYTLLGNRYISNINEFTVWKISLECATNFIDFRSSGYSTLSFERLPTEGVRLYN